MNIDIACIFTEEKILKQEFLSWYEEWANYEELPFCFLLMFLSEEETEKAKELLDTPEFIKVFGSERKEINTLQELYGLTGKTYVYHPRLVDGNVELAPWM